MSVAIYQQNEAQISNSLSPPPRRLPKWLAWLTCLLQPLQWDHDLLFYQGWTDGSTAPNWASGNTYAYGNRVVNTANEDLGVYELMNKAGLTSTVNPALDTANWFKVLDTFIGIRERANYNGSVLMLEWLLNRYYQVYQAGLVFPWSGPLKSGANKQIYISTSLNSYTNFYISNGNLGANNAYISNRSGATLSWLGNSYAGVNPDNFTVYVPSAIASSINANLPTGVNYVNVITSLIQKYCQCNFNFNVTTY
jgi:hypothetical protein